MILIKTECVCVYVCVCKYSKTKRGRDSGGRVKGGGGEKKTVWLNQA